MNENRTAVNAKPRLGSGLVLLALILVSAWLAVRSDLRRLTCTVGDRPTRHLEYKFGATSVGGPLTVDSNGCTESADGFFVPPNQTCLINLWLVRDPGERGRILLGVLRPDGVENRLLVNTPHHATPQLAAEHFVFLDEIDLPILPRGSLNRPELILESTNRSAASARILRRIRYSSFADARGCLVSLPRLYGVCGAVAFFLLGWRRRSGTGTPWVIGAIAIAMIFAARWIISPVAAAAISVTFPVLLNFVGLRTGNRRASYPVMAAAALWGIGWMFVQLRYPFLAAAVNTRLDPDSTTYREYAELMALFSPTGFFSGRFGEREPLYVFVAHLLFKLIGPSDLHLRYASFLSAIPLPFITYWIARLSGARRVPSLIAASIVTIGYVRKSDLPYLLELPSRGLRDDLFMTMSGIFILVTLLALRSGSRWRWIAVAIAGVVCMWTRSTTLFFAVAFLGWLWLEGLLQRGRLEKNRWASRWRLWEGALCVVVIFLSFLPIRLSWKRIYGHADHPERGYARWNANIEFQERLGTPGFATKEEFQITPYSGPPLTMRQYLFELHTPAQLAVGILRGTLKSTHDLLPQLPRTGKPLNYLFSGIFAGLLIASLAFTRSRVVTMGALASLSYGAFFYDRALIEFRSLCHALPLFAAAAATAGDFVVRSARGDASDRLFGGLRRLRELTAPNISVSRAAVIVLSLVLLTTAAAALRFPPLPPSPNAFCFLLRGFYWKLGAFFPWVVALAFPWLVVAIAITVAAVSGLRWWAGLATALLAIPLGFMVVTSDSLSGPTPRTFLWQKGDVVERLIHLRPWMRGRALRLRYFVREPFRTQSSHFGYVIEVNGQTLAASSTSQCPECIAFRWQELTLPATITTADDLRVRFLVTTDGDQSLNYVDVGRIPFWRMGKSTWNGLSDDLSPDVGVNGGTPMIGVTIPGTSHDGERPWFGR